MFTGKLEAIVEITRFLSLINKQWILLAGYYIVLSPEERSVCSPTEFKNIPRSER